jgi:NAD(P)-dependent dehydrogenase (short-subunit alcohol dehydrogenase family)
MHLQGRVAVVTGGARGIGEGIARCLAEDGARVAILDLDGDEAARSAQRLGAEHTGLAADVSDEQTAGAAMEEVVRRCGRIDFLVNNAGGGNRKASTAYGPPFTGVAQEGWDEQMVLNLRTTFAASKTAIAHLKQRDQGVIVNIASIAGLVPSPTMPAYGAAKAAVISLTRTLALELAAADIRVHAICPGLLYTRAWQALATNIQKSSPQHADKDPYDVFLEIVRRQTPLGREQTPEDIGRLTAFLCSDAARNLTGQVMALDGGMTLHTAR